MANSLFSALVMTVIGMGLVFVVIYLMWGMMSLFVHLIEERTGRNKARAEAEVPAAGNDKAETELTELEEGRRRRLAVAATVAVALAGCRPRISAGELASGYSYSDWSSGMRISQLTLRAPIFRRRTSQ